MGCPGAQDVNFEEDFAVYFLQIEKHGGTSAWKLRGSRASARDDPGSFG